MHGPAAVRGEPGLNTPLGDWEGGVRRGASSQKTCLEEKYAARDGEEVLP